jgi:hypothetical protein
LLVYASNFEFTTDIFSFSAKEVSCTTTRLSNKADANRKKKVFLVFEHL